MITLKQMEALYWIAVLGTFNGAARKLNASQSAISKRIQELEQASGVAIFERDLRTAKLTENGERMVLLAKEMLALRDQVAILQRSKDLHRLRLGVSELCAMTWLPALVTSINARYPNIRLEPEVDMSRRLYHRLQHDNDLDVIVIPEVFSDPAITAVGLKDVTNVWMASPQLVGKRKFTSLQELDDYILLTQGAMSGSGMVMNNWFQSQGIKFRKTISSASLTALVGMAVAGVGITYGPRDCFSALAADRKLKVIPLKPELPRVRYAAMYRNDIACSLTSAVAKVAQEVCNFDRQYQDRKARALH